MIQVIGVKRIMMLLFLLAFVGAVGAALYLYIIPEKENVDRDLRSTRSQVSTMRADAQTLRTNIEQIEEKKSYFNGLQSIGFTSDQNRLLARRRINDIQQYSKVLKARYDIGSAKVLNDSVLQDSNQVVLSSDLSIDIEAMDDIDVYSFIYWLENSFPGHVVIDSVSLTRRTDVNDVTIREIGSGRPLVMMGASVNATWRTVVEDENLGNDMNNLPGGF